MTVDAKISLIYKTAVAVKVVRIPMPPLVSLPVTLVEAKVMTSLTMSHN